MTALQPFAQVRDLTTNAVLATTANLVDYEIATEVDRLGTLSVTVGAGDPGDASGLSTTSFAAALLQAASDLGAAPKPLLLEFSLGSLDGSSPPTIFDSRRLVRNPVRSLQASARTLREEGTDLGDILGSVALERATYSDMRLADVFNGQWVAGSPPTGIVPLAPRGILQPGAAVPYLSGIFVIDYASVPGMRAWASGARGLFTISAVIHPALQNLPTTADSDADTVLNAAQAIVSRLGGAASDQAYGHWVLDVSDPYLNLSGSVSFVPSPGAQANAFVVGHQGTSAYLAFDATGSGDVDETAAARVHLDASSVQTDDSVLYAAANMVGGRSTAGFPENTRVTALAVLNNAPPAQSAGKDQWYDCLPILGIEGNGNTGGVFHTILDGRILPLPGSPSMACHALAVDTGSASPPRPATLYMGTTNGVYYASGVGGTSLYPAALTWAHRDGLDKDVTRLLFFADTSHNTYLIALVKGVGEDWDGVWRWSSATGAWSPHLRHMKIADVQATDYQTIWVIDEQGTSVYRYQITDAGSSLYPTKSGGTFPLPSGKAFALGRAISTASPTQDSIWALVSGAVSPATGKPTPAFYLPHTTGGPDWALPWYDANQDGSLHGPSGEVVAVYTVSGPGVQVDSAYNGPLATVFVGTELGALWSDNPFGGDLDWQDVDMSGLGNYAIKGLAMGQGQVILGRPLSRLYAISDDDLFYSSSSGRWWETIKGRDRTLVLPYLTNIYLGLFDDLPANTYRTWGTTNADGSAMLHSPLSLPDSTHVYVPPTLVAPNPPTLTSAATGGTVAAGTYGAVATYVNGQGETLGSASASVTTTGATSAITVGAPGVYLDATGWYLYMTQAGGSVYHRQQPAGQPSRVGTDYLVKAPPGSTGATPPGANTAANSYAVPQGYYFERYLDGHDEFQSRLVGQAAHLPGQQMSQITQMQTLTSVSAQQAAQGVVRVMQRWLRQNSVPKTTVTIESSFSTPGARLRSLRPTHRASLTGTIAIQDVSSAGVAVTTDVINFAGTEALYVLSHRIRKGPGNTATTTTVLSPVLLETPLTPSDLALGQSESLRNIRVFR